MTPCSSCQPQAMMTKNPAGDRPLVWWNATVVHFSCKIEVEKRLPSQPKAAKICSVDEWEGLCIKLWLPYSYSLASILRYPTRPQSCTETCDKIQSILGPAFVKCQRKQGFVYQVIVRQLKIRPHKQERGALAGNLHSSPSSSSSSFSSPSSSNFFSSSSSSASSSLSWWTGHVVFKSALQHSGPTLLLFFPSEVGTRACKHWHI